MCLDIIYLIYMTQKDLVLNNLLHNSQSITEKKSVPILDTFDWWLFVKHGIVKVYKPQYSTELAPCDLFLKLKNHTKYKIWLLQLLLLFTH